MTVSTKTPIVKSFLMNPAVHVFFRIFAKHANVFVATNVILFFMVGALKGGDELSSMLAGAPFLALALPGAAVLFMQNAYEFNSNARKVVTDKV